MPKDLLKIILVDDDEDDRLLFAKAIDELHLETDLLLMEDCFELMKFVDNPDNDLPSIIFLDLNMPVLNGLNCLLKLKEHSRAKDVTVAIYSTSASDKDIEFTFVRGANIYINKPSSFAELKKVIKKVLTLNWQYHNSNLDRNNFLLRLQ